MSAPNSIPPNLEPELLKKAGEGLALRAIAAWLLAEHGVKTSHVTVQRVLARIARERAPIAQAVVREELSTTLTSDLRVADGILARALADEETARAALAGAAKDRASEAKAEGKTDDGEPGHEPGFSLAPGTEEWKRCMDAASRARNDAMRVVEHRAKLSGAAPEGGDLEAAKARLLAKLKSAEAGDG